MAQGSSDEELLRDLCNSNGLQYEQVISSGSKKTKMLEMFFFGIPRISGLHYFPNLRVFRAVNQNMQTIEGLEACPCLEELWLCECKIKRIQGLEKCTKLKKLFLYQNHIAKIEGLEKLHLLSVLWLNSNQIETIEGLSHLENLQDLNLAENKLERIGNGLDGLEHLHVLNLSANNISRFEDLAPMFDLPSLEEVSLADPMYEPNPVSKLCNYSTHLLYHLPCVKRLDGRDITHPYLSNIIKLVVFRKKQFYSMRETHLNLVSSAGCSRLRSRTATKLNPLHQRLRKIQLHLKTGTGGNEAALDGIRSRIAVLEEECKRLAAECEKRCREQELQAARTQHWLRVELQSGGNIKYCEGTESHPWMGPCRDIVSEMMDMEELKHLGIVSCTVSGVTKVDNRGCQLAVDKAVKSIMLSPGLPDGTKVADYITYFLLVWKEGMSLEAVMENGKFPKQEDGSVVLTSRVSHAIQHIIPRGDSTPTSVSAVLCQVFMRPLQGTHQSSSSPDTPAPSLQSPEAPSQSVIVNVPSELVLAEYIVNLQIAKVPASSQPSIKVPDNDLDVCTLVCPTLPEIEELNSEVLEPLLQQEDVKSTEELRLCGRGIRRTHPSFQPLMSAVRSLDLSHNRLTTTAHVENMPNLVSLGLSYNAISSLEGMKGLLKLQYIDLSWNSLNNLSEVASTLRKNTPNLLILDLRGNEWEECLEDTPLRLFLIGHLKLLQCLNGVRVKGEESEGALRAVVSSHLSMATIASKVRASPQVPQTLSLLPTADYLHEKSSMRPSQLTSEQSDWWKNITSVCGNKLSLVQIKAVGKCSNLKWASFSHNHLQQLDGLEECGELEELHADHNWLRKIDSACSLTHLVHLSLSHNLIPTLSPLGRSPLLNLKYLDISSNRLTSLSGVEECSALLELYAGNNKLKTARDILPVKRLPQVMILDLYGNPIHTEERMLRLYAAYHITTLKTFNGTPLESKEFTAAKEMYGGRLNAEFVQEKTGHSRFHELKQMDYPHCNLRIVELQPVNQFASLLSLNLEHNQLTSFNGLLQLPNLKVLCLNHNKIERLSTGEDAGGGVLPSLQVLHVAYNQLGSLVPLQLHRMPTLRALFLQGNQLVNLDGLIGLTKLTELVLDHNKIRNIGEHSFSSLTDLRVLHIEENRLRELRNFAWLVHLEKLFLGMNRIQEFADLDELCALSHVNELSLLSNPVSRRLHYRTQILCRLPHLTILDGVTVTEDEQMRVRAILHEQEPAESYGIVHTSSGPFVVTNMSNLPQDGIPFPTIILPTRTALTTGRVWALDFNEEWAEFEEWQRENGRQYTSEDEMKKRFSVFKENKKTISHLNNLYRERGMKFTVNQFADLTPEEFRSTVLMRPLPVGDAKRTNYKIRSSQPLPTSFDWREKNVVSSVKDQGTVGSCWAFSTVGNIEGQWALKTKSLLSLSPELLVDCDDSKDPQHNHADCGVFGGWPYLAYDFIKELGGIETESDYPYCSGTGDCYPCPPSDYNKTLCGPPPSYCNKTQSCPDKLNRTKFVPGLKVQSWMPIEKNETAMMYELVQRGPLSVLIDAGLLQFYHSGVWDPLVGCGKDYLDHAVLLVGYGVQKELLSHKPYWLIKNSWGKKWGMDGYFKMIRGKGKCGIDLQVTTAILD